MADDRARALGLLWLRLTAGGMMLVAHGWPKLMAIHELVERFPDPLGIGSATSAILAVGAEAGCSLLLICGLWTRWAAVPLIVTMLVAAFLVHGDDPWAKKEFALVYMVPFVTLALMGPGEWSVDAWRERRAGQKGSKA